MIAIVRTLFVLVAGATVWLSAALDGVGLWGTALAAAIVLVFVSLFLPLLGRIASVVVRATAALAAVALALTLLAGTVGGSFRISESVQPLLFCFFLLIAIGLLDRLTAPRPAPPDAAGSGDA